MDEQTNESNEHSMKSIKVKNGRKLKKNIEKKNIMKWETKFGDLHTEQHICSICIILHIQTIRTHIIAACRMRMLNDFYFDIDNIMGKQASPYKIHPCNNIKVFFSVILSSVWPTMWKAASTLRCTIKMYALANIEWHRSWKSPCTTRKVT